MGPIGLQAVSGLQNVTGRRLRTYRDLGRERAADDVPTHLPEAMPATGTQLGLDLWRTKGAADLGTVGDTVTASDH
jgi:hypothetical protein